MFVVTVTGQFETEDLQKQNLTAWKKQNCKFYVIYRLGTGQWVCNTKIIHAFALEIGVLELAMWAGQTKSSVKLF